MGIENIVLIDPDKVEIHNLDRLLYAAREDVGTLKVELVAKHLHRSANRGQLSRQDLCTANPGRQRLFGGFGL